MDIWVISTFLAIMNKVVLNTHVQVSVRSYVFISLGVKLPGRMVTLCLTCGETLDAFDSKRILNYQHVDF